VNSLEFESDGQCAQCGEEPLPVVSMTFLAQVAPEELAPPQLGPVTTGIIELRICAGCLSEAHGFVVANITKESSCHQEA
jgi:hypothetical protein